MLLRSLSQLNFRNLKTPFIAFKEGITAIVGMNAAGKSNCLEAIYLATTGELNRGRISEALHVESQEGFVSAKVERADGIASIHIGLAPGKKLVRLDNQTVRTFDIAKVSTSVLITPEDSSLIHGSPSGRRHYLDSLLSRLSLRYAMLLREYARVVEQRNAALKRSQDPTLDIWTSRFLELGQEIVNLRNRAVKRIAEIACHSYQEISSDNKQFNLGLSSQAENENLSKRLAQSQQEERARAITVVGPHRDDMYLTLNGHSVQAYGSRGEARTASLALRVAEYQLLREKHDETPMLLIDDFTAELDSNRRAYLLKLAASTPQSIVSGTESPPQFNQQFHITGGQLHEA